jgi:hypothetical protein
MMMKETLFVTILSLASTSMSGRTSVIAQELCAPVDFCGGLMGRELSGNCAAPFFMCEAQSDSVESSCDGINFRCRFSAKDGEPKCSTDCVPDCDGKECGEDGCGGFCGACGDGEGCSNYTCVSGIAAGTCASPFNLGNSDTETVIDTDDRITIITVGDTSQSFHIETPSCNTLTASPEAIYSFSVPPGRTYG